MSSSDDFRKKAIHKQIDSNRNIRKVIIPHDVQVGRKNKSINKETLQSLSGSYQKNELVIRKDQSDKFTRLELNNGFKTGRGTTIRFTCGGELKGTMFQRNVGNMGIYTYVKDLEIRNYAGAGSIFVQAQGSSGYTYLESNGGSIFLRKDHTGAQFKFDVSNTRAGFGTTNPSHTLHVKDGNIRIGDEGTFGSTPSTTSDNIARLELIANGNSNNVAGFVDTRDDGSVQCMQIGTKTAHDIRFYGSDSEAMRLSSAGKLSLGGVAPDRKLHVYDGFVRIGERGTFGSTPSTTAISFARIELMANANSNDVQCLVDARDDGSAQCMQIGTRSNHNIKFYTNNSAVMRLENDGNLMLGADESTTRRLHVVDDTANYMVMFDNQSTSTSADGIIIQLGPDTESDMTTNNTFIAFRDGNGSTVGRIRSDAGGGGVAFASSFTGAHVSVMPAEDFEMGLIVDSTGDMWANHMGSVSTALPSVVLSSDDESSKVYGVLSEKDSHPAMVKRWGLPEGKIQVYVNGLGEGKVWVTNKSGDITNGDYITTSIVPGYGMKQSDDILRSCTVAKCAESVDWSQVTDTVTHDGVEYKKYLIGCTYHCS